ECGDALVMVGAAIPNHRVCAVALEKYAPLIEFVEQRRTSIDDAEINLVRRREFARGKAQGALDGSGNRRNRTLNRELRRYLAVLHLRHIDLTCARVRKHEPETAAVARRAPRIRLKRSPGARR